ncbi:hypothetical protein CCB80_03580 [Armatimonadetes bacterium Uphvl-Ar1]|nr:hypothetical protein CCB80_03580 [Armatimonadetes bacterium Uphvl-Ar1]
MTSLIPLLALTTIVPSPQQAPRQYNGKLKTFYLLGEERYVIGSKEIIEIGKKRRVALNSVRTAIAFGSKTENIVAQEGKMLVILEATVKNPEKGLINVSTSELFGLRFFDANLKPGDVVYRGGFDRSLNQISKSLKSGESVDSTLVFEFPQKMPHLKMAIYFDRFIAGKNPHYDLTKLITSSGSVFAKTPLEYSPTATVAKEKEFDFDELRIKVIDTQAIEDNGHRVRVKLTNPMVKPISWGWQYATAETVDTNGQVTPMYRNFYPAPEHQNWRMQILPGQSIIGDYYFYPKEATRPTQFKITMNATRRSVTVTNL